MILAPDGSKLSKRKNATAVMDYERMGYLPEALCNYLARLGWGHGDDEVFTREQFVEWFSVEHLSSSSSQWDPKKLNWMNNHYINQKPHDELVALIEPRLTTRLETYDHTLPLTTYPLAEIVALYKSRCDTLVQITDEAESYYLPYVANIELINEQVNEANRPALKDFAEGLKTVAWDKESINALIKSTLAQHGLKMPAIGLPLRAIVLGQTQSPSLDNILWIFGREEILHRLSILQANPA